ncbi:MAG: SDR family NAD(P)-dependent oxidoreductase, partial [Kiloniellales bacterium]|nr:SDR family NAD(P)-dependent oxidoreductase [Kiloniellales bacterium]
AGGIGLAAIQYAQHVGAEIYATAGNDEKRELLALCGVPARRIFNSRSLDFAEAVMRETGGKGVDVVLNSLAGEALRKGIDCLRPFGRFIELGKRDFYENSRIGLRPFRNNISFFGVDADQLMMERPHQAKRLFQELTSYLDAGIFRPLPYREFSYREIVEAFRFMQQSRQIGKILVNMQGLSGGRSQPMQVRPKAEVASGPKVSLDPDGVYLVAGGLDGFGLSTAEWLVTRGARRLLLASRRGRATGLAQDKIETMRSGGVRIDEVALDVTSAEEIRAVLGKLTSPDHPLKGIVHAAAVFDDATIANMNESSLKDVLAPKVAGACALHQVSIDLPLDFFLLFSSVTTFLGNPGQGAYVAANAYLEGLVEARRRQGLPATAVCWGAIKDAGYLAREEKVLEVLTTRLGVEAITAASALDHLDDLLCTKIGLTAIAALNFKERAYQLPILSSKYSELLTGRIRDPNASGGETDFSKILEGLDTDEIDALLREAVKQEVARVLRAPETSIDVEKSIF